MRSFRVLAALCVCSAVAPARAADPRVERLVRLATLWGEVKYLHPWIETRHIDWDAALLAAIPAAEDAATRESEIVALRSLLASLHDPATAIESGDEKPAPPGSASRWEWPEKGILAVHLSRVPSFEAANAEAQNLAKEIAKASAVVVDVRAQPPWASGIEDVGDELELLLPSLVEAAEPAGVRSVLHQGHPPDLPGFGTLFTVSLVEQLPRAPPERKTPMAQPSHRPDRVVLLADATSPQPLTAIGAIQRGSVQVVAQGPIDGSYSAGLRYFPILPGVTARVRGSELLRPLEPDVQLSPDVAERAWKAALSLARRKQRPARHADRPALPEAMASGENSYPEMPFPDAPHRLLALFRLWTVIEHVYPYRDLLDHPWEDVLPALIPVFEGASNEREYLLALWEAAAHLQDGHVSVIGTPAARNLFGAATLPFRFRMLDGQVVVTQVFEEEAAKEGLKPGDTIVAIDGEPIATKAKALEKYVSAATPVAFSTISHRLALRGPLHSKATLSIEGAQGNRDLQLDREKPLYLGPQRSGPVVRVLDGNVGYVDLDRLEPEGVDAMFAQVMGTRALIFDMRGYPKGTFRPIAPRLNRKSARYGAIFRRPVAGGALADEAGSWAFELRQALGRDDKPRYEGRVFMLIDETAVSQAEHTALFFEAACDVTFVGSNTAGTDGNLSALAMPGGVYVTFTGFDVRHADGRQLQRIGIVPQVRVLPTRAGLREGRDEVLERALSLARGDAAQR